MGEYEISGQYLKAKVDSIEENLRESNEKQTKILEKLVHMESRISKLEVKSGFWGVIGGCLVIIAQMLIKKVGG